MLIMEWVVGNTGFVIMENLSRNAALLRRLIARIGDVNRTCPVGLSALFPPQKNKVQLILT